MFTLDANILIQARLWAQEPVSQLKLIPNLDLNTSGQDGPDNTILNLNENQGGAFDDLFKLTMNVAINILILMESHLEN